MDLLVTPEWLSAHLEDPKLVVLDATLPPVGVPSPPDTHARYLAEHIPGAVFFDIEALSDHSTKLPHMLPSAEDFARSMGALGVSDTMTLVVYEQEAVFSAPRAWWMLKTFGAQHVCLLDGGLRAWTGAGLPTEAGPVKRARAEFHATHQPLAVRTLDQVQQVLARQGQVLDARAPGRFLGKAPEPRAGLRSGHMPGAVNVPFTELLENGRLKSPEALRQVFRAKGIDLDREITTTCGSGVTAAVVALAAERCGARQVSLYDGSWAEYAQTPGVPILPEA